MKWQEPPWRILGEILLAIFTIIVVVCLLYFAVLLERILFSL